MEESSNGKIKDTQKVETEQDKKEVDIKDVDQELKLEDDFSVREVAVVDGNSESVEEKPDEDETLRVSKEQLETEQWNLETEKEEGKTCVESAEEHVNISKKSSNVPEEEAKEFEDKNLVSLNVVSDEKNLTSSDERAELSSAVTDVSEGIEEKILQSDPDENIGVSLSRGIEEVALMDQNPEKPSGNIVSDQGSVENVDAEAETTNTSIIGSNDGIISVREQGRMQASSWRSCCGLFDVLRRSHG